MYWSALATDMQTWHEQFCSILNEDYKNFFTKATLIRVRR